MQPTISHVVSFIEAHWHETIREMPNDDGDLLGMPFPYTVPCRKGGFQELYYWDTFYTNEGLIASGRADLARNNTEDLLSLVDRFGFVPNGNRTHYLGRSQPPHLALMVAAVHRAIDDISFIERALPSLEREHSFWMERRLAPNGLNRYGTHDDLDNEFDHNLSWYRKYYRLPLVWAEERDAFKRQLAHQHAECESGWDFTPRFDRRCGEFTPIDLNSLLYAHEQAMSDMNATLGRESEAKRWHALATQRRELIQKLLFCDKLGTFIDLDYVNEQPGPVLSAAIFYPIWLGVATPVQAASTAAHLPRLEAPHGIHTCEPGSTWPFSYQWDTPNGWPPLHYAAVRALQAARLDAEAARIAGKYLKLVARVFEQTGDLWEKYHVVEGSIQTVDEYEMPAMLGWTAGVFAALARDFIPKS